MTVEKSFQCSHNRSRCQKFVNWHYHLNFFGPVHSLWDEHLLSLNILQFWSYLSSFEIPWSQEIFPDAIAKSGMSVNQSYRCENKFHQYDHTLQLLFGSVIQVLTNFAVLVSFHSPATMYVLQYQVSILEKRMPTPCSMELVPSGLRWKLVADMHASTRLAVGTSAKLCVVWTLKW